MISSFDSSQQLYNENTFDYLYIIPDEKAETFKTVGDVANYIESKLLEAV